MSTLIDYITDFKLKFLILFRLRMPSAPSFVLMGSIIPDAVVIAIVIFATNVSLAKVFAKRNNYVIDSNQVIYDFFDLIMLNQSESLLSQSP